MIYRIIGFLVVCSMSVLGAGKRPNVIFILCDDLGYGDVGTFFQNVRMKENVRSEPSHLTPNIDALATEGMRLTDHYCPAPVCAPSRASLLSGIHQGQATVRNNQFDKQLEDNHTLATIFKKAGYATAAVGKWGLQGKGDSPSTWPAYPLKRGFDFFHGYVRHGDGHEHYPKEGKYKGPKQVWENDAEISSVLDKCYTTDLFTARAKKWIVDQRQNHPEQSFFLYLAYDAPHAVLELPTMAYPAGGGIHGGLQWSGDAGRMINTADGEIDSYFHPDYAGATWDDDKNPATPEVPWQDVYKRYATSVRRIDDCVGDLRKTLEDLGIGKDTLIVFTTDNGPSVESYLAESYRADFFNSFGPFDGIKRDILEGGVRVGAIVSWPGSIPAGRTSSLPSQFDDWMPTFSELAGLPAPARTTGTSLVPVLTDRAGQKECTVYSEYSVKGKTPDFPEFCAGNRGKLRGEMQMIRRGNHVGIRRSISSHADDFEIFDVTTDRGQRKNLATSMPSLQRELKEGVLRLRRPDPSAPRPYDNELIPGILGEHGPGIDWRAYKGDFPWVPNLEDLKPVTSGIIRQLEMPTVDDNDIKALGFSGYIRVPVEGTYTFFFKTGSRAHLRLHQVNLIDADFSHSTGGEFEAKVNLQKGDHPFTISCLVDDLKKLGLSLEWSGPGLSREPVPSSAFLRSAEGK